MAGKKTIILLSLLLCATLVVMFLTIPGFDDDSETDTPSPDGSNDTTTPQETNLSGFVIDGEAVPYSPLYDFYTRDELNRNDDIEGQQREMLLNRANSYTATVRLTVQNEDGEVVHNESREYRISEGGDKRIAEELETGSVRYTENDETLMKLQPGDDTTVQYVKEPYENDYVEVDLDRTLGLPYIYTHAFTYNENETYSRGELSVKEFVGHQNGGIYQLPHAGTTDEDNIAVGGTRGSLYVDQSGIIRRAALDAGYLNENDETRFLSVDYRVSEIGSTTVETPPWADISSECIPNAAATVTQHDQGDGSYAVEVTADIMGNADHFEIQADNSTRATIEEQGVTKGVFVEERDTVMVRASSDECSRRLVSVQAGEE